MPLFTIMHIFEVPAKNQYQATEELMEAREFHQEKVYHVKTIVRLSGEKRGIPIDPRPLLESEPRSRRPAKWGTIFKRQLTGKW
jgi:hypothetical protein